MLICLPRTRRALGLWLCLALTACASPPMRQAAPPLAPPARWAQAADAPDAVAVSADWWRYFGSDGLTQVIEQADRQSHDIAASAALARQTRAAADAAGALRWPQLSLELNAARVSAASPREASGAVLTASYELDLWGRLDASHAAAQATWSASRFDHQAVRLGVLASVANAWLQAAAGQEQLALARQDLETAQHTLAWVTARQRAGAATRLDRARQQGVVAEQTRQLAIRQGQLHDAQVTLGRLLGQAAPHPAPTIRLADLTPPRIDAGLPSALLLRRPDLARAEAQLAAADASLAAARSAMLPTLNLSAALRESGEQLVRILERPVYSLAAALSAPVFNAGRLAAQRDEAGARRDMLLATYHGAIAAAFADTQAALNAVAWLDAQYQAQQDVLAQAQHAWRLVDIRYQAGAAGMLDVLDAQRTLYAARSAALQLQLARLQASVSLFRALGGGWRPDA